MHVHPTQLRPGDKLAGELAYTGATILTVTRDDAGDVLITTDRYRIQEMHFLPVGTIEVDRS